MRSIWRVLSGFWGLYCVQSCASCAVYERHCRSVGKNERSVGEKPCSDHKNRSKGTEWLVGLTLILTLVPWAVRQQESCVMDFAPKASDMMRDQRVESLMSGDARRWRGASRVKSPVSVVVSVLCEDRPVLCFKQASRHNRELWRQMKKRRPLSSAMKRRG